jgi:hypothetical protein
MFSQALFTSSVIASVLLGTSISTSFARPRLVKDVTYVFPAGGATLETMAKNVVKQFGVGNSQAAVGKRGTLVADLCEELGISSQTLTGTSPLRAGYGSKERK